MAYSGDRSMERAASRHCLVRTAGWTLMASVLLLTCGPAPTGPASTGSVPASTDRGTTSAPPSNQLTVEGLSIPVPSGWSAQQQAVIGTAFGQTARTCGAVEVIDGPAPSDSGLAVLDRAAAQICVIARDDDLQLERWLAGRSQNVTTSTRYGTCVVRELPGAPELQLAYAQGLRWRAEIATTVTTTPERTDQRRLEVADVLMNARCPTS